MLFTKSLPPAGPKQAPMPGPGSAAYKKIIAARKAAAAKSAVPPSAKKKPRPPKSRLFSTLKSRQMAVERARREIWASVHEINQAIINLALCGNYNAAKALFDFAGVYALPSPDDAAPSLALPESGASVAPASGNSNPVDAFFKSIGIDPVDDDPDPDMAVCASFAAL